MTARIAIDLNVRVHGNLTYAGFEDASEPVVEGEAVIVCEPESDLWGVAQVVRVDRQRELIYLEVDWSALAPPAFRSPSWHVAFGPTVAHIVTGAAYHGIRLPDRDRDLVTA